jgi:hypothetical protein
MGTVSEIKGIRTLAIIDSAYLMIVIGGGNFVCSLLGYNHIINLGMGYPELSNKLKKLNVCGGSCWNEIDVMSGADRK